MPDIVVAGHLCVDIIPHIFPHTQPVDFIIPGHLTEVGKAVIATGGAVSNTGLALHRLGMNVRLVARLGDDHIAYLIRRILASFDACLVEDLVTVSGEPSSYTIVLSPPNVDRSFLHCPGTNHTFGPEDVRTDLLARARLFHFGYPPLMRRMYSDQGRELGALLAKAQACGATTSLDMAMPDPSQPSGQVDWPAILSGVLPHTDIFAPSIEESLFMLNRSRFEALAQQAHSSGRSIIDLIEPADLDDLATHAIAMGTQMVAIKVGHRGLYLRTGALERPLGRGAPRDLASWRNRELWAPAFQVHVVGTVGAGDATVAGLLAAILRGQSPEEAITTAVAVGACNVEAADAISGVQTWEATLARLQAPWPRLAANITAPGWRFCEESGLWYGPADARQTP